MDYQKKTFSVSAPDSEEYRKNYDAIYWGNKVSSKLCKACERCDYCEDYRYCCMHAAFGDQVDPYGL